MVGVIDISMKLPLLDSAYVNVTLFSELFVPFSIKEIEAESKSAEA
jgi:hypothetical protein